MTPKQRLQTLANFLRTVPPEKFDLENWRSAPHTSGTTDEDPHTSLPITDEDLKTCGTTACAVGWACSMPAFKAEGLYYNDHMLVYAPVDAQPLSYWRAAEEFFGLSYIEARWLFSIECYNTPSLWSVIGRLEIAASRDTQCS